MLNISLFLFNTEDGEMRQERRSRGDPSAEGGDTGPPMVRNMQGEFLISKIFVLQFKGYLNVFNTFI